MKRPYPWKCRTCREQKVNPVGVDYATELEHDGRVYPVKVNGLEILRCENCGAQLLPDEAHARLMEALRYEAGLLTPAEIKRNRDELGLTQKQLADSLRIAESTVCRWETGAQIQQRAMDLLLRIYFDREEVRDYLEQLSVASSGFKTV